MVGASKFRRAARKMGLPCGSFSRGQVNDDPVVTHNVRNSGSPAKGDNASAITAEAESGSLTKNLCAICLECLSYNNTGGCGGSSSNNSPGQGQAIFTAQCSHSFHFTCISSNVRHGSVTCPICRAHWTQLPRDLNPPPLPCTTQTDPILRILDDSIATFRVHRRTTLRSARYNDDDPVEPDGALLTLHRLQFNLAPLPPPTHHPYHHHLPLHQYTSSSSLPSPLLPNATSPNVQKKPYLCPNRAYLSVKLSQQPATDLVLVASPNGPHLRLLKQSMALVVFSLRSIDRLAIVTYSSTATRAFPLRRMTCHGKRTALQVIDRLFYMEDADPGAGLKKGIKILEDRTHQNPHSSILHLSDCPTYLDHDLQLPAPIYRFHVGFGFGMSNGFVMHEFEEFLARLLGGVIRDVQLRIGDDGEVLRLGELRGGEERKISLDVGESEFVCVAYSYIEGGGEECLRTGEIVVSLDDKRESDSGDAGGGRDMNIGGRTSNVESWDYHDPYMARRWAKHLHGYRL